MILKKSDERTDDLTALKRLKRRCDAAQKQKLDRELKKLVSGIRGEQDAARIMNRIFGDSDLTGLIHDLRIGVGGEFAQIDHLIIHRVR